MYKQFTKELDDTSKTESINSIQFSIMSPAQIKEGSVCEIMVAELYDGNTPKTNGLFDPRMGILDRGRYCSTCENDIELCPGHFGHINLALPVFNINYSQYVIKLLSCICFRCSNLLVDKSDPIILNIIKKTSGQARYNAISAHAKKSTKCEHNNGCQVMQPTKYVKELVNQMQNKDNIFKIYADFKSIDAFKDSQIKKKHLISPELCSHIFSRISYEDCEILGFSNKFSRPEWMIITTLPVPPPSVRPSVRADNNVRSEDDLTFALSNIIKTNKSLRHKIDNDAPKHVIDGVAGLLQYYVATYLDNEIPGVSQQAQRSGRPLKAYIQRLKAKEGRLRGNIMGKRVDFSARTVISVDPNISIDEYGVPYSIAMNLTFPEVVTKYNIDDMYKLIRNGPNKYPGAKTVQKMTNDCNGTMAPCTIALKHTDPTKNCIKLWRYYQQTFKKW